MPKVGVPNRLLLIVAKRTLLFFAVIITCYFCVTTLMTGLFSTSVNSNNSNSHHFPAPIVAKDGKQQEHEKVASSKTDLNQQKHVDGNENNKLGNYKTETSINVEDVNKTVESDDNTKGSKLTGVSGGSQLLNLIEVEGENEENLEGRPRNDSDSPMNRIVVNNAVDGSLINTFTVNKERFGKKKFRRKLDDDEKLLSKLPICPQPSPNLIGKLKQAVLLMTTLKENEITQNRTDLKSGGRWRPSHCRSRHKIAIILPFRDRQSHLNRLIDFLIPMLQRQLLDFRFIVTEQYGHDLFNKGRIMNAAFEVAENLGVDCVLFHDVDMFPQDDRNFYGCPNEPRHIGAFVNTLGYELWYDYIVGGVLAIQVEHYKQINGYSNMYWAWGGEDDDMGYRILANNFTIERPDPVLGRMTMLKHIKRSRTAPALIHELLKTAQVRWVTDGLNDTQWKTIQVIERPLYYHLYVDVGTPPDEWREGRTTAPPAAAKKH